MAKSPKARHDYARELAAGYAGFPEVQAVVLGGSLAAQAGDSRSDVDLYVYHTDEIRIDRRTGLARTYCRKPEINNQFWETGDEWIDEKNGIHVDVMYRSTTWVAAELRHILIEHRAATGYSTCLWFNVLHSEIIFDRAGWFADLQKQASVPYPEALQRAIIQKNWPILRHNLSSYRYQLQSAIRRKDDVSINHRLAAMLQSYFDILFALNSQPHPGEKGYSNGQNSCVRTGRKT